MKTPCQLDPDKWVSDNADEREEAEHACGPCPLIIQCYDLASTTTSNGGCGVASTAPPAHNATSDAANAWCAGN